MQAGPARSGYSPHATARVRVETIVVIRITFATVPRVES